MGSANTHDVWSKLMAWGEQLARVTGLTEADADEVLREVRAMIAWEEEHRPERAALKHMLHEQMRKAYEAGNEEQLDELVRQYIDAWYMTAGEYREATRSEQ